MSEQPRFHNFPFIFCIDVLSFKPGTKPTWFKTNRDHKTFDSAPKKVWKMEEKAKIQACVLAVGQKIDSPIFQLKNRFY